MSERTGFYRKVAYGVAIAVLLFPLSLLSAPATVGSPGGKLAQLRTEYRLGQGDLGEIDPASETIKLATLGLRGLAANLLWEKANHYKKVEDWTNLAATLEQLAKLQPNFITFWKFQSWNLSYNVSVEFDDFRDRYYWVRRGIEFLQQGDKYNRDNPVLLAELGWVNGHKIGRSDEKKQYRRLYKADEEFHPVDRPPADRDNWLVSKGRYRESIASVDEKGKSLGKKSPSLFYSAPAKSQMNYAEAIERDGLFERAVAAWRRGEGEWVDFGRVLIEHSTGPLLRLGDEELLTEQVEQIRERLTALLDGVEERVVERAREGLSDEQRAALEVPPGERDQDQSRLAYEAEQALKITPDKLSAVIAEESPDQQRRAEELAADLRDTERRRRFTVNYKDTTNYDYWMLRCQFEQTEAAVAARELIFRAERAFRDDANLDEAKRLYEESFDRWAEVFEQFPKLLDPQGTTGGDIMFFVYDYKKVLDQLDEDLGDDFPLWNIIEQFDTEGGFTSEIRERQQQRDSQQPAETPVPAESTAPDEAADADTEPASAPEPAADTADADEGEMDADKDVAGESAAEPEAAAEAETATEAASEAASEAVAPQAE